MTRTAHRRLKEIDDLLLRYAITMQTLLLERARLDPVSTQQFITTTHETFLRVTDPTITLQQEDR